MSGMFDLSAGILKNFYREKVISILIVVFPVLMVVMAVFSAPSTSIPLILDDKLITPAPTGEEIVIALYSLTSVVFVASITSFFISYQVKSLVPRLNVFGYGNLKISSSMVMITMAIGIFSTFAVVLVGSFWLSPYDLLGYVISLFVASVIFSTVGLIISEIVDSKELGLYLVLTVGLIDTAFLENPMYSRRYNDPGLVVMPGHAPVQMLLRSSFDTGSQWFSGLAIVILYEMLLFALYLIIKRRK